MIRSWIDQIHLNLPQLFNENRLFIRSHESEFFLDRFWNDFGFRCHLRTPRLTRDFTPYFIDGVVASQVIANKGAKVDYAATKAGAPSTIRLDQTFCDKSPVFELSNDHRLRLKLHRDSLFFQDASERKPVAILIRPGVKVAVDSGVVLGLGLRQQHKVRVVLATPTARPPPYTSTAQIYLNQYSPKDLFAEAAQRGDIHDVQTMNDFAFTHVRPEPCSSSALPRVALEFIEGPKTGLKCEFTAQEDLANRDVPHFKIGHTADSDIFLEDLDVAHFSLDFKFDSRFGWRVESRGLAARAFIYARNWDQIDKGKMSFYHLLAFDAELVTEMGIWKLEKQVSQPEKLPVAAHRASAAADMSPQLLLFQFGNR